MIPRAITAQTNVTRTTNVQVPENAVPMDAKTNAQRYQVMFYTFEVLIISTEEMSVS